MTNVCRSLRIAFSSPRSIRRRTEAFETLSRKAASLIFTAKQFVLLVWSVVCFLLVWSGEAVTGSASVLMFICLSLFAGLRPGFIWFSVRNHSGRSLSWGVADLPLPAAMC